MKCVLQFQTCLFLQVMRVKYYCPIVSRLVLSFVHPFIQIQIFSSSSIVASASSDYKQQEPHQVYLIIYESLSVYESDSHQFVGRQHREHFPIQIHPSTPFKLSLAANFFYNLLLSPCIG